MKEVISKAQRNLNATLHNTDDKYGNRDDGAGVATRLPAAILRLHELGLCNSVLDYGTGKGALTKRLQTELPETISVKGYDPAVTFYEERPENPVDLLVCLDVLEHIEMANIDAVLKDIHSLTKQFCYLVIDLQPAVKTLSDGRNAHILLAPPEWWISRISQLFPCIAAFPILHRVGLPQKIVIVACNKPQLSPIMYGFVTKLKIFDFVLDYGVLGGKVKRKKPKSS